MPLKLNPITGKLDLVQSQGGTSVDAGIFTEYRVITLAEFNAKELTLLNTPTTPDKTQMDIIGGTSQEYSSDFSIIGDVLSWLGLQLELTIHEGDKIRIQYYT